MEYIEGETLAERLKKGALPLDKALEYGIQIADGLNTAHRAGIVHRDLKPGNAMLTKSGIKLLDFGLAKQSPVDTSADSELPTQQKDLTEEGSLVGTLQYMAPEQLEGKAADARTDIFAFGAVLHEMLTGQKAFRGGSSDGSLDFNPAELRNQYTPPALRGTLFFSDTGRASYDVAPDGQRFVMITAESELTQIVVVLNWFEELKRLVPTDK